MSHDLLCPNAVETEDGDNGLIVYECQCDWIKRVRDDEARAAADRVEALPWLNDGRTVNRNAAILAARRNLSR